MMQQEVRFEVSDEAQDEVGNSISPERISVKAQITHLSKQPSHSLKAGLVDELRNSQNEFDDKSKTKLAFKSSSPSPDQKQTGLNADSGSGSEYQAEVRVDMLSKSYQDIGSTEFENGLLNIP